MKAPVEFVPLSVSQLCELVGYEPSRFVGVFLDHARDVVLVLTKEPEPVKKKSSGKKSGKRDCD